MQQQDEPGTALEAVSPHGQLQTSILSNDEIERVWRIAKALAASHMFKDVTQAEQAFGRILLGRDLGLSPTQALMAIDVVEGNARVRSVQLAAWVRQHPDYDYAVTEHDAEHCVIDFYYEGELCGTSSYSMEDARNAQLVKDHPKSAWRAHPKNMLFARAMSNGVRWYCPEVTGGIPVYTEADTFDEPKQIGQGEGSGEGPGWGDMPEPLVRDVEALIEEAKRLGHAGLSDVATVQVRLHGQSEDVVREWIKTAVGELNKLEPPEAEVVE